MQAESAIHTKRLTLLPSSDERDLGEYRRHLTDPDEFFCQYGLRMGDDVLDAIDFHSSGVIYYTVFLGEGGPMVGYVGINPFGGDGGVEGELEFHTFRERRGRGYCTEASAALLAAFFDGRLACGRGARVSAEAMPKNAPTLRVLEKLGFRREATGMCCALLDDGGIDHDGCFSVIAYGLVRADFEVAAAGRAWTCQTPASSASTGIRAVTPSTPTPRSSDGMMGYFRPIASPTIVTSEPGDDGNGWMDSIGGLPWNSRK